MITYIFFYFLKLFYYTDDQGDDNHEAWNTALGCAQSAYKYNLRILYNNII